MNNITDGVRDANDMTFGGTPDGGISRTENTPVTFTCTADANPPQNIAIWTRNADKIAESTGQTELITQLVMTRSTTKLGYFVGRQVDHQWTMWKLVIKHMKSCVSNFYIFIFNNNVLIKCIYKE